MSDVLPQVTSPLALAALALLLGAGILKVMVGKRTTVAGKMIIRYGFGLAVLLSVLANVSFIAAMRINEETLITGSVADTNGRFLPRAIIDVPGAGRAVTDDNGSFSVSIPSSRKQDQYRISVSAGGFEPIDTLLTARDSRGLRLLLKRVGFSSRDVTIENDVMVSHYVGIPQVDIPLRFLNRTAEQVRVTGLAVTLVSPRGEERVLIPAAMYAGRGAPMVQALPQITLAAGGDFEQTVLFVANDTRTQQLMNSITQQMARDDVFAQMGPQPGRVVLDGAALSDLEGAFERNWSWEPGTWTLQIRYSAEGTEHVTIATVDVTDSDISSLREVIMHYDSGFGLLWGRHVFLPGGGAAAVYRTARIL